ncbi:MAG: hypothetical protein M3406_02160 [Chloroflexota bacterium]|nr:hypothetical protein [Chloroflexota bacterium]
MSDEFQTPIDSAARIEAQHVSTAGLARDSGVVHQAQRCGHRSPPGVFLAL